MALTQGDKNFKERWEKIRNKGRLHYALVNGATFGFFVFLIINLWYLQDKSFQEVFVQHKAMEQMLTMVFAGMVGYGVIKWWLNEKLYAKIIEIEKD